MLSKLMACLEPQLKDFPEVELIAKEFTTNTTLGENRQALAELATGDYVSFIDDDDLVADDYVATIYPLLDGVDMIGFMVACYNDGTYWMAARHSLNNPKPGWYENGTAYRDINEKNPILREKALQVKWEGGYSCDSHWAGRMRDLGLLQTENFINRPMYTYLYRSTKADA